MRFLLKVLKGALIGMSVVIPGVSGGSMAMAMGIYDQLIDLITVDKNTVGKAKALLPYILGAIMGIAFFAYFIELMFTKYPLATACLFLGMILGCLPMLLRKVKGHKFLFRHAVVLLSSIALMIFIPVAGKGATEVYVLLPTWRYALLAMVLGVVAAATMVIPGVSGSMVLMTLGYYEPVLQHVNAFTASVLSLNWAGMVNTLIILLPFAIGVAVGIIIMARGVRALFRYFPVSSYYGIIGLVLASSFAVLYHQPLLGVPVEQWLISISLTIAGFFAAMLLGKGEKN